MLFFLNIMNQNKKNLSANELLILIYLYLNFFRFFNQYNTLTFKNLKFNIF